MKKIILAIALIASFTANVKAQDEAIFNHYIINPMLINPAYAGFDDNVVLFGHLRSQWAGYEKAPKTYALSLSVPVTDKVGLGGVLVSDQLGSLSRIRAKVNYAYKYLAKGVKLSVGFSTEFEQSRLDNSAGTSPNVVGGDPLLQERMKGVTLFDASFGACALINEAFIVSFSTPNLIGARLNNLNATAGTSTFLKQFVLLGGYRFKTTAATYEPSLVLRKVYTGGFEAEVNLKASLLDERLILGLTGRPGKTGQLGLMVGTKLPSFQVMYSYHNSTAEFRTYESTAHEVTVGIMFNKPDSKIQRGSKKNYRN